MVDVTTAIEYNFGETLLLGQFGDLFSNRFGGRYVAARDARAFTVIGGRSCRQRDALQVVNQLDVDMVQRPVHIQPWTLRRANHLLADAVVHSLPRLVLRRNS